MIFIIRIFFERMKNDNSSFGNHFLEKKYQNIFQVMSVNLKTKILVETSIILFNIVYYVPQILSERKMC